MTEAETQDVRDIIQNLRNLENTIAAAAIHAGRGPSGLALNVAKTLVFQARGAVSLALEDGAAVGSG